MSHCCRNGRRCLPLHPSRAALQQARSRRSSESTSRAAAADSVRGYVRRKCSKAAARRSDSRLRSSLPCRRRRRRIGRRPRRGGKGEQHLRRRRRRGDKQGLRDGAERTKLRVKYWNVHLTKIEIATTSQRKTNAQRCPTDRALRLRAVCQRGSAASHARACDISLLPLPLS